MNERAYPHFSKAAFPSLFPYSPGYSVDEQHGFVSLEHCEDSGSMALRNEELPRVVEHWIAVPARKQVHTRSRLYVNYPRNVFSSSPSLLAFILDLFQLVSNVLYQDLRL